MHTLGFESTRSVILPSSYYHPVPILIILSHTLGGRPDSMQLLKEVYKSWNAEVVFITTNLDGNKEMMEGCKVAGIPAFVRPHFIFIFNGLFANL